MDSESGNAQAELQPSGTKSKKIIKKFISKIISYY
jgi:hypothetical protein